MKMGICGHLIRLEAEMTRTQSTDVHRNLVTGTVVSNERIKAADPDDE